VKQLKRRRASQLSIAEAQVAVNRDVIESLRKIQQEMRGLVSRQHGIERQQEQLALALIRAAVAVGGSLPSVLASGEVPRG
jgi:hypothetical protein